MTKPGTLPLWMELTVDRNTQDVRVSARGSRGEQTAPHALGPERDVPSLIRFASAVQHAATHARPLSPETLAAAQALQQAVLGGEVGPLFSRLREASGGPLLVRVFAQDPELQAVPWEAICKPGEALGFWGSSPDVFPVRGVTSSEPWQPREVLGAVRVLAIAPSSHDIATLKSTLADRIATGEIQWLDPIEGQATRVPRLFDLLRREPIPHVVHFIGHGGLDERGMPVIRPSPPGPLSNFAASPLRGEGEPDKP